MAATKCTRMLRTRVNYYLKNSPDEKQRERYAIANLLASVTLSLNDYKGFTYLPKANARQTVDGFMADDESRRHYHGEVIVSPTDMGLDLDLDR